MLDKKHFRIELNVINALLEMLPLPRGGHPLAVRQAHRPEPIEGPSGRGFSLLL